MTSTQVAGVSQVFATSTLLESTSLVVTFGIDLFAARVAPSKTFDILSEDFNKVQLILTLVGLLVALSIVRPIVR
jgi:ER membrane protein complex subunit 1